MDCEIRHMLAFRLKYPKDSAEAKQFIADSKEILGAIPAASRFEVFYEVSPKNSFDYGFSFDFATPADYEAYNNNPAHVRYVQERWLKEVEDFMEIDFTDC